MFSAFTSPRVTKNCSGSDIGKVKHSTARRGQRLGMATAELTLDRFRETALAFDNHGFAARHVDHASGGADRGRPGLH